MSASPEIDCATARLELLSIWNQSSPRVYISVVLCFPLDNALCDDAVGHLETSLERLGQERPLFAARLAADSTQPGHAHLIQSPEFRIPFEVSMKPGAIPADYSQIRENGFPPGVFIKPCFSIPGLIGTETDPLPVSRVQAFVIPGGLLLAVYLHHSLCDGDSLRIFLECLAAQTRGDAIDRPSEQAFDGPRSHHKVDGSLESLISKCPEYTLLPNLKGPTQPRFSEVGEPLDTIPKIGKIFVFKKRRIAELQRTIESHFQYGDRTPSTYTCLAALSFAHIVSARLKTEKFLPSIEVKGPAKLWNSVNWRSRAFQHLTGDYFGNAALPAVTRVSQETILRSSVDIATLASLVPHIKGSIDAVDQEYVKHRLAMVSAMPDPRYIGVNYDPRMSQCLAFNTWRHFGADAEWEIPGVSVKNPEAIRRAHGSWNLGTALILPARASADSQELFVSLSQVSMDELCKDTEWLKWVDSTIG
ncbi:hypothetical protein BKA67DRAFT_593205 [Truncatella angustata]|uniref:C-8 acyltransferase n=1 Tax=Truncatella angustata TaxID=152316 RepID=A0A9P8UJB3_9PEZI|nr:uncharacterized protein BKA67DRAFT_593205 [Truncatella angustata]KAH6653216.1 hypothetical protein BKA67DRAFT_593205 [Truncatella angustata]KAH8198944.1 hypothetical protein TruAng_006905 [Truncatella angustata]